MARLFAAEGSEPYARDLADKNDSVDYESWREIARTLESKASAWVQAEGIDLADDSEFEASAQAANRSVEYWWTELDYGERQTYCLMRSSDPDSIYEAAERNLAPLYGSESSEWIAAALSNHLDYVC